MIIDGVRYASKYEARQAVLHRSRGIQRNTDEFILYQKQRIPVNNAVFPETMRIPLPQYLIMRHVPDFLLPNGLLIETKGVMDVTYPQKVELLAVCHPSVMKRYRVCFGNADLITPKRGTLTYAQWAHKQGITWCEGDIPESWFMEEI